MATGSLGKLWLEISAKYDGMKKAFDSAERDTAKFSRNMEASIKKVSSGFNALKTAIGAAVAVGAAVKGFDILYQTLDKLDNLGDTAEKIGVSAEALQEFRYAAEQSGSSVEQIDKALLKLNTNIGMAQEGTGRFREILDRYNISLKNVDGSMKTTQQVFMDLAKLIAGTENASEKATIAAAAMGEKLGPELLVFLNKGVEGINSLQEKARELGIVLSNDLVNGAGDAKKAVDTLKQIIGVQFSKVIAENADDIIEWTKRATEMFSSIIKHADDIKKYLSVAVSIMAGMYSAKMITAIGSFVVLIIKINEELRKQATLYAVLSGLNPWKALAAIAGVTVGVIALNKLLDETGEKMGNVFNPSYEERVAGINKGFDMMIESFTKALGPGEALNKKIKEINAQREKALEIAKQEAGLSLPSSSGGGDLGYDPDAKDKEKRAEDLERRKAEIMARYRNESETLEFEHQNNLQKIRETFADNEALMREYVYKEELDYADKKSKLRQRELDEQKKAQDEIQKFIDAEQARWDKLDEMINPESAWLRQKRAEMDMYEELGVREEELAKLRAKNEQEWLEQFGSPMQQKIAEFGDVYGKLQEKSAEWLEGSSDMLTDMVMKGKADFKSFANAIISDLVRMIIKQLLFNMLSGFIGNIPGMSGLGGTGTPSLKGPSTAGGVAGVLGAGKAGGGLISGPTIVGERGPEIVIPQAPSRVLNSHVSGQLGAQSVKVEVVNRGTPQQATDTNVRFDARNMIIQVVMDDLQRGGKLAQGMGSMYGMRRTTK